MGIGLQGRIGRIIILTSVIIIAFIVIIFVIIIVNIVINNTVAIITMTIIIAMITISLEESSNFDDYLKELGVGFILRQLAQVAQPTVTVDR